MGRNSRLYGRTPTRGRATTATPTENSTRYGGYNAKCSQGISNTRHVATLAGL